jgi:hypothetical protein
MYELPLCKTITSPIDALVTAACNVDDVAAVLEKHELLPAEDNFPEAQAKQAETDVAATEALYFPTSHD